MTAASILLPLILRTSVTTCSPSRFFLAQGSPTSSEITHSKGALIASPRSMAAATIADSLGERFSMQAKHLEAQVRRRGRALASRSQP